MSEVFDFGCANYLERKEPPTPFEYTAAELWVRKWYEEYFKANHPIPQFITWQLDRLTQRPPAPTDPVLETVMEVLDGDFRNTYSNSTKQKVSELLQSGGTQSDLTQFLKERAGGGSLKPDMLGLSASRVIEFDAVEVGTLKTAKPTYDELQYKLGIIQSDVVPKLKMKLPEMQLRRGYQVMATDFRVGGSKFRLTPWQRIYPLPVQVNAAGGVAYADWLCFHPSTTWAPGGATSPQGTDGVMLYHIHRSPVPKLPERVRSAVEKELRRWNWEQGKTLELNPALAFAARNSGDYWDPEHRKFFIIAMAAAVLVVVVLLAWELGVIAVAGLAARALLTRGLVALAASPAQLSAAVGATAEFVRAAWPFISGLAPLLQPGH